MSFISKTLKKVLFISTAVLAGICLFIFIFFLNVNKTVLNPDFHKQLFEKNKIYSEMQSVIDNSMNSFIIDIKKNSPSGSQQYTNVLTTLEKSITPKMVKYNLDSVRDQMFQYFKGKRIFLPDVYLNVEKQTKTNIENSNPTPSEVLSQIDKINLSVILLSFNRSDISDTFFELKFFTYLCGIIPNFSILFLLIFLIIGLFICTKRIHYIKWMIVFLSASGLISLFSGIGLIVYSYLILPEKIYLVTLSLPFQSEVIISYIRGCITPISVTLIVSGIFLIGLAFVIKYIPSIFSSLFKKVDKDSNNAPNITLRKLKSASCIVLCLLVISSIVYKANITKKDFEENDFSIAISKLQKVNTVTEVISAKNDAIYGLNIKLVDRKTKEPIANAGINISGKSENLHKNFYETVTTDDTGTAKYILDKGTFRISFFPTQFPTNYQIPSPFFFDMKSAGTTIITVNLDLTPEDAKTKWGIAEIELLDKENNPIPDIELYVQSPVSAPGEPDSVSSYSNSEGIAVFKLNDGNYKIGFTQSKFPSRFQIPSDIDVSIAYNTLNRYTIRIEDAKID